MARGLEYDDAVLKEVFNLILDDPLPRWEMEQLHVLNFWDFSLYVHHRKDWQILNPPDVCSDHPALLPPSSQVHDHLLTPTEKRRNRRKRAAQVAASASESAPASPEPVESAPASPEPAESAPASPESVESAPASPESVESAPASPESVESAPASPESVESAPASPESVESAPASPESVESAPASPESVEFAPASPESVEFTPVSPESVEFTPVTPESVSSVQILPVWVKVSSVIPELIERVAVTPEAANDTYLSPQRCKRRAHIVQSNALISEVPSTLAQEGPSQVPPSSVVPEDPILMVPIPVDQEDQSRESSNPLVQEGLYQEAPSSEVQESLSQEVANQVVQEDQTQLIMYSVVPEVYSLEPTSKPPTPPAKPVLKENETALSELFMRPVLSKVDPLISSVASTETVLDLAMEVIPEHLTLPVMAMEATSEQRANLVLALETLSKHSCLPAKATETILGLSSSLVITTETEPASHVSSSGSAPALVMEAISGRLDLPAIATEASPELLVSHDSPKEIIPASFVMSSQIIPARQNSVKKSVTAPALCTSSRSDGTSETVYDVTLVQESSRLSSLPTSAVMAPEFVPKHFLNQETASIRDSRSSWEFPPVKRPPISRGVTNRVPIPPSVLPGCHAPPKIPPFWAVPKYSPGLFSALPAPPPVFLGYTGPPIFPPHLPPQLVPPLSLINPVLPRIPSPSVDAWRRPLEGGYCQGSSLTAMSVLICLMYSCLSCV